MIGKQSFHVWRYDVWAYDVWTYDVWRYDVLTYDVLTYDVWRYDVWRYDVWTYDHPGSLGDLYRNHLPCKLLDFFCLQSLLGTSRKANPCVSWHWTPKIRFPHAIKNSLKTAISIYDFVTFWPEATDGSFFSSFEAYMCMVSHMQCTYTSPYNVWQTLHTTYEALAIQRIRNPSYNVRMKWNTMYVWNCHATYVFGKKKLKKCTIRTIRRIERVFKKDDFINIATYLRIGLKIQVIYLDFGTWLYIV